MFATIGHTFELIGMSWRVLMKDRELILFPIMSGAVLLVVVGLFAAMGAATGTLDRMQAASSTGATEEMTPIDVVLGIALYTTTSFVVIFFNSALVAAALERLRGGDPNVRSGLNAALSHLPTIFVWALISATVGLILQMLRGRSDNPIGRIAISIVGGVWAYMTFFVVPVLVAEGIGPIAAIKRSGSLFRQTWGRQFTASFGFGLVYVIAALIAFLPAAAIFTLSPLAGIVTGALLVAMTMGTVMALEGIFKAALYEFSLGESPAEFDRSTLSSAYRAL